MRRWEFITLLGGTAATWPLATRAQQPALPVVGLLAGGSAQTDAFRVTAVRQGLAEAGYVEGRNMAFGYRWAEHHNDRLPALAADLVHHGVALIASVGGITAALAAKAATGTIPIVFEIGGDPVRLGLVSNLSRPGGNITGASFLIGTLDAKLFQIMHETLPKATLIGFLVNPTNADTEAQTKDALAAAASVGQRIAIVKAHNDIELETAFATLSQERAGALVVSADIFFLNRRNAVVELAANHKIPTIYNLREFVGAGGLMSYGASITIASSTPIRRGGKETHPPRCIFDSASPIFGIKRLNSRAFRRTEVSISGALNAQNSRRKNFPSRR